MTNTQRHRQTREPDSDATHTNLVALGFAPSDVAAAVAEARVVSDSDVLSYLPPSYATASTTNVSTAAMLSTSSSGAQFTPLSPQTTHGSISSTMSETGPRSMSFSAPPHTINLASLPPPPEDELPEYRPKDAEQERRDMLYARRLSERQEAIDNMWRQHEADKRAARVSAQRRASTGNPIDRWNRWSAKFYMPMLNRWDGKQ